MSKEKEEWFKRASQHDVCQRIPFRCSIGKREAEIWVTIEPDPHGDDSGAHSHFHAHVICKNTKIVDMPEPDRCKITNCTCPFISSIGEELNPEQRKFGHANMIIQGIASIEFYGAQLVNEILQQKGLKPVDSLKVADLEKIMVISNMINTETYQRMVTVRHVRNNLAHSPNEYLKFTEKELFDWSNEAKKLSWVVAEVLEKCQRKGT